MLKRADFRDHADRIRPHIEAISGQTGETTLFTDVKAACENDRAFLFVDGDGFVVLKPMYRAGQRKVLVWIAYSREGDAINNHLEELKGLAVMIGATGLEHWTGIESMNRYSRRLGWEKLFTVWSIPL